MVPRELLPKGAAAEGGACRVGNKPEPTPTAACVTPGNTRDNHTGLVGTRTTQLSTIPIPHEHHLQHTHRPHLSTAPFTHTPVYTQTVAGSQNQQKFSSQSRKVNSSHCGLRRKILNNTTNTVLCLYT